MNTMRDIKFRAWDKQKAEYIDMFLGFTLTDGLLEYLDDIMNEEKNVIIEQYTGIKDANGVKIYENDVVRVVSNFDVSTAVKYADSVPYGYAKFEEGRYVIEHLDKENHSTIDLYTYNELLSLYVIDNKHNFESITPNDL